MLPIKPKKKNVTKLKLRLLRLTFCNHARRIWTRPFKKASWMRAGILLSAWLSIFRWRVINRRLKKQMVNTATAAWQPLVRPPSSPRASAGGSGADSGVAELGHGCGHWRGHGGGGDAVFSSLPPPAPPAPAAQPVAAAAGEGGQEGLAEARVHEAVNDGVDAGRGVG